MDGGIPVFAVEDNYIFFRENVRITGNLFVNGTVVARDKFAAGSVNERVLAADSIGVWEVIIEPPFPHRRLDVILTLEGAADA